MSNVIKYDFRGNLYSFREDGWFNATEAAKRYGKRIRHWLDNAETKEYVRILNSRIPGHLIQARRGAGGGTWLHPKLAVVFARWLNIEFAVWCDEQIDELLRSGQRQAMSVYQQLVALQLEDANSFAKASFGSHLMLDRKRELPSYRARRRALEVKVQLPLFREAA